MYVIIESPYCTPETNKTLYVKKKKESFLENEKDYYDLYFNTYVLLTC